MTKMKDLLKGFAKEYKDDTIATQGVKSEDPPRLPTDWFAVDLEIGGGIPEGRATIVYGPEDSMKTSLCLKLVASAQRRYPDKSAVYIDIEGVFSKKWARTFGVDVDKLVYIHPDNAEQMVDMIEGILYADDVSIVCVDSLAALLTEHEAEKSASEAIVGRTGLVINKFYRKASMALGKARRAGRKPTLVCINQIRFKIGVTHGNPETMPGGPAFKYFSSLTLRVYGKDVMETAVSKDLPAYKEVNVLVKKHKVPILAKKAILQVALQPIPEYGLEPGEAYDWNTLLAYLKSMDLMVKGEKKGWVFTNPATGEQTEYKVIDELKEEVYNNPDFGSEVKQGLIELMMKSEEVID
jgi:recombination protein RecA